MVRNPPANAGDMSLILEFGGSSGGGHGNPLQYSCLENPMDPEKPGGLQSIGSQRVGDDLSDLRGLLRYVPAMLTFWRGLFFFFLV